MEYEIGVDFGNQKSSLKLDRVFPIHSYLSPSPSVFTLDEALADKILGAGRAASERMWRLPMWSSIIDEAKCPVSDLTNINKRQCSASYAALFLEKFTDSHPSFAHLDIAGTLVGKVEKKCFKKSQSQKTSNTKNSIFYTA